MILYTLVTMYLTGCIIFSCIFDDIQEEDGSLSKPTKKERFIAGVIWPVFFYNIIKKGGNE